MLFVQSMSSLPLAMKTPACLCGSTIAFWPPFAPAAPPRPVWNRQHSILRLCEGQRAHTSSAASSGCTTSTTSACGIPSVFRCELAGKRLRTTACASTAPTIAKSASATYFIPSAFDVNPIEEGLVPPLPPRAPPLPPRSPKPPAFSYQYTF